MKRNPIVKAVAAELNRYGIRFTTEVLGNGHVGIRYLGRLQSVSNTPRCPHAHKHAVADCRKILRAMKISVDSEQVSC